MKYQNQLVIALLMLGLMNTGCFRISDKNNVIQRDLTSNTPPPIDPGGGGGDDEEDDSDLLVPAAAVAVGPQVLRDLASKTRANLTAATYDRLLSQSVPNLSREGDVDSANPPLGLAMVTISAEYCDVLVQRRDNVLFPGINFGQGANQISNDALTQSIDKMAKAFWGRAPSSEEITVGINTKNELLASGSTLTARVMTVICTGMLAAPASMVR
jgi:hypothetical protein